MMSFKIKKCYFYRLKKCFFCFTRYYLCKELKIKKKEERKEKKKKSQIKPVFCS